MPGDCSKVKKKRKRELKHFVTDSHRIKRKELFFRKHNHFRRLRFTWKGLKSRARIGPECLSDCPTTASAPELIMTSGLYTVKMPFSLPPISRPPVPSAPSPKLTHTILCNLWDIRCFSFLVHYPEIQLPSHSFLISILVWPLLWEIIMKIMITFVLLQTH